MVLFYVEDISLFFEEMEVTKTENFDFYSNLSITDENFQKVQLIFENPEIFLINHFDSLRTQIDLIYEQAFLENPKLFKISNKINEIRCKQIELVVNFEKSCFQNIRTNIFKDKLNLLKEKWNEAKKLNLDLNFLLYKLECLIFMDKTLMFFSKKEFLNLLKLIVKCNKFKNFFKFSKNWKNLTNKKASKKFLLFGFHFDCVYLRKEFLINFCLSNSGTQWNLWDLNYFASDSQFYSNKCPIFCQLAYEINVVLKFCVAISENNNKTQEVFNKLKDVEIIQGFKFENLSLTEETCMARLIQFPTENFFFDLNGICFLNKIEIRPRRVHCVDVNLEKLKFDNFEFFNLEKDLFSLKKLKTLYPESSLWRRIE